MCLEFWLQGLCPGWPESQNVGHFKCVFCKWVLEQTYTDSLSDMAPPLDNVLKVIKLSSACDYISRFIDIALYLED